MIPPVQIPDFAGTLLRGQQVQQQGEMSRLQMLAQQQALSDADAFRTALGEVGPQLGGGSEERMSALMRLLRAGPQGASVALPMIQQERERAEGQALISRVFPGFGAAPAQPAAPTVAPASGGTVAALPPAPARGDAPPAVAQGIAARAALDPNAPDYPQRIIAINNAVVGATMPGGAAPRAATPASAPQAQPAPAAAQGQAGLPTPQQLMMLMMSGNPTAMRFAQSVAPLVARDNPNWTSVTADGQVFMVNPQNPSQRVLIGRSDGATTQANMPFGTGSGGAALAYIEQHAPAVAAGTASPEVVRRYLSAVTEYQQERVSQDGTRIVPRLPGYAPGADAVAGLYPGVVPGAPAAPAPRAGPAQPGGVPIPGTTMQASPPELVPAPVPGAAGGVARTPQQPPNTALTGMLENVEGLRRAQRALQLAEARPESFGAWQGAANMLPGVLERLDPGGVEARAMAADLGSLVVNQRSGAAVTAAEFPRLRPFIPQVGDPPEVVRTKLTRFVEEYRAILQDQYEAFGPRAGFRQQPVVEEAIAGRRGPGSAPPTVPRVGEIREGWRFRGGNPADRNSWERAQ